METRQLRAAAAVAVVLTALTGVAVAGRAPAGVVSPAKTGAGAAATAAAEARNAGGALPVTITVAPGARQTFAGFGASMGNWEGEYQALPQAQRARLSKRFWRDLNFKILRLWFNVDDYSPTRGTRDLGLFRRQYVRSGVIADARANGVTTLLLAPDHIPPYMRPAGAKVDGPINDAEVENFVTLIADGIRQLRDEDRVTIHATGVENEPDMTPAQLVRAVKRLRKELDARGLRSVKIIASEAASADDRFYSHLDAFRADRDAWDALAGIASHSYNMAATDKAAGYIAGPDGAGGRNTKEYWMTEASDNGPEDEGMTGVPAIRAASLASRFLNDMNHRVTHWVHFLGAEGTKAPNADDATRIIAFEPGPPARYKVMKKYHTYQQLARAFDVGAVFRDSHSSLDGDMTWTYGKKPHLFAAAARNPNGAWSVGVCNFTADSFLKVQGWADDKWNVEQGGRTPGQSFIVTVRVDELKDHALLPLVVHRTNATAKNARSGTVTMKNGVVTLTVAPLELVTLRSSPAAAGR